MCDTVESMDPADFPVTPQPIGPPGDKVCIVASRGDVLHSTAHVFDNITEYTFSYCEEHWVVGRSWDDVRFDNLPFWLP